MRFGMAQRMARREERGSHKMQNIACAKRQTSPRGTNCLCRLTGKEGN